MIFVKFRFLIFISLFCICSLSTAEETTGPTPPPAQTTVEKLTSLIKASAGLGMRNTNWSHIEKTNNTQMSYTVDSTNNAIMEGDISIPSVAVKFGFNLLPENTNFNRIQQSAGYLGFRGFTVFSEGGRFAGHAKYNGRITAQQTRDVDFNQAYRFTELDYTFSFGAEGQPRIPILVGLRYTSWDLPAEICLLHQGQSSGPTVFDPTFKAKFYSLIFGMDFFKTDFIQTTDEEKITPGWGVMFKFITGFGFGKSQIGDVAANASKILYNKTMTTQDPSVFTVHTSGQLGPKYTFTIAKLRAVIGLGYDWNLLMLINTSAKAQNSTTTQPVAYPNFVYQGWIMRGFVDF